MMAEALQTKQEDNSAGGWQNMDATTAPVKAAAPQESVKDAAARDSTRKMYFTDDERRQPTRALPSGATAAEVCTSVSACKFKHYR